MDGFRKLKAEEIECRVAQISKTGSLMLLLYKDARVDQRILDETFGVFGWQRHHEIIGGNLYCTVSVKNPDTGEWIEKQDVGTKSNTEEEKGQASDSFKRACFNLGIGRELYTSPTIWVRAEDYKAVTKGNNTTTYDRFVVKSIGYDDAGNINQLVIYNSNLNKQVFKMGETKEEPSEEQEVDPVYLPTEDKVITTAQWNKLASEMNRTGATESYMCQIFNVKTINEMSQAQVITALNKFKNTPSKGKK